MERRQLNIEPRTKSETGKNQNNRLRAAGYIPGILYSHGQSESIKITKKDFFHLFKGRVSESVIFYLVYKDKTADDELQAFVKKYQVDPVTDEVIHLDLFKVTKGEKIHTNIPIEVVGTAIGVKRGGQMEIYTREIEIECLPKDLPEKIQVDVSELAEGDSIHAKSVNLGEDIKLLSNPELVLVAVHATRITAEEVEEVEAVEGEVAAEEAEKEEEKE
jgi:large subunit ribosomal protein L25